MIWQKCELKRLAGQTEDALGNLTGGTWLTLLEVGCRHTPWTNEQIALEGREVTRNEQQFVIPVPIRCLPRGCTHVTIDNGPEQEITQVIDLSPRWTVIRVRVYKE